MAIEIGTLPEARLEDWLACDAAAFGGQTEPEDLAQFREFLVFDRCQMALDEGEIVSTACVFPFEMSVPGAVTPMAGVSFVSVKPTHRRKGVLTAMMRHQLEDVRERGESMASLWASESVIYGRFGYGMSSESVEWEIDRPFASLTAGTAPHGRFRLVSEDAALRDWPAFFDSVRAGQPGMFSRSTAHWKRHRFYNREKAKPRFWVQYEVGGQIAGYAYYRNTQRESRNIADNHVEVMELIAANDEAYTALWRYIFGIDLVSKITAYHRPVDEPLVHMLIDPRRLQRTPQDGLWLRVVDAEAALATRRYSREGSLVVDVTDRFLEWGNGRYLVEGGPEGATCSVTTREPEIRMGIRDLGAVYMGATSFTSLARAGRVEGEREALLKADGMFRWEPQPWCPEVF